MMTSLAIAVNVLAVLLLVLGLSNSAKLLGPVPRHEGDMDMPYETGEPPFEDAHQHMSVMFHRFAVLFVVFDVDLAFLLPWALNRRALDMVQVASVSVFAALVAFMLAYLWRRGALECSRGEQ